MYRGKNWPKISLAILERDNFTCQHCGYNGTRETLDCHHIIPYRLFKNMRNANIKHNLITLCRSCHSKADNEYWAAHPEFFDTTRFPYPTVPPRPCEKCGEIMDKPSPHRKVCDKCSTFKCDICGKVFISLKRGGRVVRICSRECNIIFRKSEAKWPRRCLDCGKPIGGGRYYCYNCWLKDPAGRVHPGHKTGRRPKDHPAASIAAD